MLTARRCDDGADAGKWYAVVIDRQTVRRAGYCALGCSGHDSSDDARDQSGSRRCARRDGYAHA